MIELDLNRVKSCLLWELKVLAAIREMCVEHRVAVCWCEDLERDTAELLKSVREIVALKGDVMIIEVKG